MYPQRVIHGSAPGLQSNAAGVKWALAGMGLFSLIYISGKISGSEASALQIMWLRYAGGALTMFAYVLTVRGGKECLSTAQPLLHACRAASGAGGGAAAVYAATHMPVASASAIGLLDGVFTVGLALIVLREVVSVRQCAAILICLTGAMVIVGSQGAFRQWHLVFLFPAAMALAGAFLIAVESILIKTLVHSEPAPTVLFYVNLFGCLLLSAPAVLTWASIEPMWLFAFMMLGPMAIVAQYCNIRAFLCAPASVIGPVRYSWVVYGSLFGFLIFHEPVSALTVVGILLVVTGGAWLATLRTRAM